MAVLWLHDFGVGGSAHARDQSGYLVNLDVQSGASWTLGRNGLGLSCVTGGATATIATGQYYYDSVGAHAISVWVRANSATPGWRCVAAKGTDPWRLWLSDDNGFVRWNLDGTTVTTTTSVLDGGWHHILATFNAYSLVGHETPFDCILYVDGVEAGSNTKAGAVWNDGQSDLLRVGHSAAGEHADAIIDEFRWFNGPIVTDEIGLAMATARPLLLAAYNLDGHGDDASTYGRDLTVTANGAFVGGEHGQALAPVDPTGGPTGEATFAPLALDRLSVAGWVRVADEGQGRTLLQLLDSSETVRYRLLQTAGDALRCEWTRDGESTFGTQTADGVLSDTDWVHVAGMAYPNGIDFSVAGTQVSGVNLGGANLRTPVVTDVTQLQVGPGAAWDDLRVWNNYVHGSAIAGWTGVPVARIPRVAMIDARVGVRIGGQQ